jgi:hypothetical protein
MPFDAPAYGEEIAQLLALDGDGHKLMPLTFDAEVAAGVIPRIHAVSATDGVRAGLFVYFGCFEQAHTIAQDMPSAEGGFWHAILHRREPDPGNAGYWFHRVGRHPVFPELLQQARAIAPDRIAGEPWDPFRFVDFCEEARRSPGSEIERRAKEIQRVEWQLLFDYCARKQA